MLIAFMEKNRFEKLFKFPFSYSYPTNCCEGASLIFRYLSLEKYDIDVEVWRGKKPNGEMHFWNVTRGGLIYDLTAHQFPREKAIIGKRTSVTANRFRSDVVLYRDERNLERDQVVAAYRDSLIPF